MSNAMTAMIDISNAEKTFTMHLQGGVELPVVCGVSFHVEPGECVVLSGPSGAGKSSILKMIFGNYRCDGGRIGIRHRGETIDLAVARLLSHRVMVMKGGRVIETGLTDQVLDDPREPYTQLLVSSILPP